MESEQNISMMQIVGILRKHIKAIFGTTIVVTLATIFVTFFVMTPKYSATTQILVNRKLSEDMQSAQFQQVQADVQMISTYKDIITSPTVLKDVNKKVSSYPGYPGSMGALKGSLSISNSQNSQVFSVTAKSTDAGTAAAIANMTAKVFKKKVVKIMSVNNVSIVSEATANTKPVSPRKTLNVIAGIVIGAILGIALAFVREITDRTVTTQNFLTDNLGLTSLGTVSEIDQKDIERAAEQVVEHNKVQSKLSINKSSRNNRRV
ncbi:YveK family protein [Companilactobacillus futsaii]|uniref:Capsular polysaccharide biosynthesis protein CpsC n=1 Tax=Companilactobacillus futsaii JCM 17355 TaxID=1423818 RepID=A0ABR5P9G1_9LACO|nr:Wzz/FepE/Etk N-terminal domain-containing protein [Companilactobacillus futsaii]KRK99852.1 capsular polysaccharide biosynthesis protein [Companilactobacillus futsaii JCM 17355]